MAIARFDPCCSPAHEGVAIYDDGIKRPRETPDHFRMLRWGSNGLSLLNDDGITLLRTPIAGP